MGDSVSWWKTVRCAYPRLEKGSWSRSGKEAGGRGEGLPRKEVDAPVEGQIRKGLIRQAKNWSLSYSTRKSREVL